ncbi:phospholipase A and acyltransferase 2-like [Apostichopus japonicus]|uniref:phospholipase A and acyltransferase 2-like n=1 Tax=Stichopus japonicus TaxID=307972 RepID=UPI003AB68981
MGNTTNKYTTFDRILTKCNVGDLLEIKYPDSTFNHWAVYIGTGYVIHVRHPWTKKEHLSVVAGNKLVRINNDKHLVMNYPPLDPNEIVSTAEDQIGIDWYNVQFYGCEMFAIRCRYGVKVNLADYYNNFDTEFDVSSKVTSLVNPVVMYGHQQHENY